MPSRRRCSSVDSVQTAMVADLDGAPGSVGQVRESTLRLMEFAKGDGIAVILVGHVTKDGSIAGPKTLEHLVDAVLSLEGERTWPLRLLRAHQEPLRVDRGDRRLRDARARPAPRWPTRPAPSSPTTTGRRPGSVVAPTLEGSRPLLVEVQALVARRGYGSPTRRASGLDPQPSQPAAGRPRPARGHRALGHDVYANLAGGLTVVEPALDLRSRSRSRRPRATGRSRPARSRSARSASLGELRSVPGCDRRLRGGRAAGLQPGDRAALRARSPVGRPGRDRGGRGRDPRRGDPGRARCRLIGAWRGRAGDARLTPRPDRSRCADAEHSERESLIRYIRVLGALLGGSIGLVLATTGNGLFRDYDASGALIALWVVAWMVVGFGVLPYLTVVPATWLIRRVEALSTAEFVTAIVGLLIGLLLGLLLGLPLSQLPDPFGTWLPLGVSIFLGLGMLGLTVAKRQDLLIAAEAVGSSSAGRRPRWRRAA